ncbi:hypothetical protein [Methylomonas methanica]|uniref:hypothetical protein n=1 Tax=Methylomonas methanica TaxID=421 RepID=UPI0002E031D8|nr:hypothetical protein [Methylomonas methanica]
MSFIFGCNFKRLNGVLCCQRGVLAGVCQEGFEVAGASLFCPQVRPEFVGV